MGLKSLIQNWLEIQPPDKYTVTVKQYTDFHGECNRALMWYRGEPFELRQFYEQAIDARSGGFWAAVPRFAIRKIHSGVPSLIVNTLSGIITRNYNGVIISDDDLQNTWEKIAEENGIKRLIEEAAKKACVTGEAYFKISADTELSKYPIIEVKGADSADVITRRGRAIEYIFSSYYKKGSYRYVLKEHYGRGYIRYELLDENGETRNVDEIPETAGLRNMTYNGDFFLCSQFVFRRSNDYAGRGESVYHGKYGAFDALDEIVSQWADIFRSARPKQYVPETLAPRDDYGRILRPNDFDDRYIVTKSDGAENSGDRIETYQPEIRSDQYVQGYTTYLDLAIEGIISPSTLGVDNKKLDNAEAQREKEKVTLYTVNKMTDALEEAIRNLVISSLKIYQLMTDGKAAEDIDVNVKFGEYANPSFEAVVETLSKAKSAGIMSNAQIVEQLYGDTMSDDDKRKEAEALDKENNYTTAIGDEPFISSYDGGD